jgi:hypothetical protein
MTMHYLRQTLLATITCLWLLDACGKFGSKHSIRLPSSIYLELTFPANAVLHYSTLFPFGIQMVLARLATGSHSVKHSFTLVFSSTSPLIRRLLFPHYNPSLSTTQYDSTSTRYHSSYHPALYITRNPLRALTALLLLPKAEARHCLCALQWDNAHSTPPRTRSRSHEQPRPRYLSQHRCNLHHLRPRQRGASSFALRQPTTQSLTAPP